MATDAPEKVQPMEIDEREETNVSAFAEHASSLSLVDDPAADASIPPNDADSTSETSSLQDAEDLDLDIDLEDSSPSDENFDGNSSDMKDPTEKILRAITHKEEGNAHFKSGNYTSASRSYRRGATLLKDLNSENTGDDQVKALLLILQTNLSMVCLKQNKPKLARDVATKALSVDKTNVKALYRRAVASRQMGNLEEARADLREALKHDADNRDVKRELLAIKKELDETRAREKSALQKAFFQKSGSKLSSSFLYEDKEEEEKKRAEAKRLKEKAEKVALEKRKIEWEDDCIARMAENQKVLSFEEWEEERTKKEEEEEKKRKKARKAEEAKKRAARKINAGNKIPKQESFSDHDGDDELTEKELQQFRGYKKTSDGRTTSYFTREQTEEEKALLGNIAPQRLELDETRQTSLTVAPASAPSILQPTAIVTDASGGANVTSVWNQAGTWEEKNTTDWCTASLTSFLKDARVEHLRYTIVVTEVNDLTGDASVVCVQGKKRYVFDYHCKLMYEVVMNAGDVTNVVASGNLKLPDISSASVSDALDIEVMRWKKAPGKGESIDEVMMCRDELVNEVRRQVENFVKAFNEQY